MMNPVSRLFHYVRHQGMGRALRHRDFAWYTATSWISTIGMWMQRIGTGWLTWELTHSGFWLGLIVAAQALPAVVLIPFTGAFAERINRLTLMRFTQALTFVSNSLLAALTVLGYTTVEVLFVLSLFNGLVVTFNMPARMTMVPGLVPRADLGSAIAVGSLVFTSSTFIGPAIGGLLIEHGGISLCFVANALSYLPFYANLYFIKLRDSENAPSAHARLLDDVRDGVRYAARHPGIGPVLMLALLTSLLLQPISDLVPGFVDHVFDAGPTALGMIMSMFGIGGMVGALWMANRSRLEGTVRIYFIAGALSALATLAFAATSVLWVGVASMAVLGFVGSARGNAAQTLIQGSVDPTHRARVISLYSLTHRAGPAIGAMSMGGASDFIGLQIPVAVSALIAFLLFVWVWRHRGKIAKATELLVYDDDVLPPPQKRAAE
jgi:MFS family permease